MLFELNHRYRPAEETVDPRIADDEDVDDNDGRTQEEIEADMKKESARANATALVLMGDLPHADVRPEENILFVCKVSDRQSRTLAHQPSTKLPQC